MADPRRNTATPRAKSAAVVLAAGGLIGVAAALDPASEGYGTHKQLGLPPCRFEQVFGAPCATCGMTTAFSTAADGNLLGSFATQPMGAVLVVLTAAIFWAGIHGVIAGTATTGLLRSMLGWRTIAFGLVGLLAAWAYTWITWNSEGSLVS